MNQAEQLVPVREAGDRVQRLVSRVRQGLRGLGHSVKAENFLQGKGGVGETQRQVVDIPAAEDHLPDMGTVQQAEIDVPQPAGLPGEILPADGVHDDQDGARLPGGAELVQIGVVGHGEVRRMAVVPAVRAAVRADMLVVIAAVFHPAAAEGAPGPIVVDAPVLPRADRAPLQTKPLHLLMVPGKAAYQGVVGVEHQGSVRMDGGEDGVVNPFGVAVAGELVPVEVGNDQVGGVEPLEGQPGVPLIALR